MIRLAQHDDIARLIEIRAAVRENRLRDPSRVSIADYRWFIDNPGIFVWEEQGFIVGFSAADPRNGSIWALFMDHAYENRSYAQSLFQRSVAVLRSAGWKRMRLTTSPGTRAETFYRRAGWKITGVEEDQLVFELWTD